MINTPKKQKGMTAISMGFILLLIGFVAIIFVKLIPVYLENFKITAAINALEEDVRAQGASKSQIREILTKKLAIDDVKKVSEKDILIEKANEGFTVTIKNETRVSMFGNVDALVVYEGPVVTVR